MRGDGDEGDPVGPAGVDQDFGHGPVRLLAREQGHGSGRTQRGDEPLGLLGPVVGAPPHQAAEHDLPLLEEAGRVLQVGGGDPADLPDRQGLFAPQQSEAERFELEKVFDVHGVAPCATAGSGSRHLTFTRRLRVPSS